MFTGIVTAVGRIASAQPAGDGVRLRVEAAALGLDDVAIGDSIAIQGACHTVVARDATGFEVDTSRATLEVTTGLEAGRDVNLEKSLRLSDRLGGHLVQGHVDGVGEVTAFERSEDGGAWLSVRVPAELRRYLVVKGSVSVDGISLTVAAGDAETFSVALIPHTLDVTTLGSARVGDPVNLEVDVIAKYVEALLEGRGA